jgi:hypothetical protein
MLMIGTKYDMLMKYTKSFSSLAYKDTNLAIGIGMGTLVLGAMFMYKKNNPK